VDRRRYEAVGLAHRVAALDPVARAHHGLRRIARVLVQRQHDLVRKRHAPDGHAGRELLAVRGMNAVMEAQRRAHPRLS
jgi:hypothetical protein